MGDCYMPKDQKREEPKLGIGDLEHDKKTIKKEWPRDEHTIRINEQGEKIKPEDAEEIAGILDHPSYKELEKQLTEMEEKANENWNQRLFAEAELKNIRQRADRDIAKAHKYSLEKLVLDLLPVVDSLERALLMDAKDNEYAQKMHQGIELTLTMLLKVLAKHGVKQVDPQDETFNPDLHQAISTQVVENVATNTVIGVLQKGYLLHDRLIRPALVTVSKGE
jgi:molecular chaperone GrpE